MSESRFVRWWENNPDKAEAINIRRREKYANDQAYRAREKERKRLARKREKEPCRSYPKPKLYPIDGQLYELWSVGRTAETLGIHKRTLSGLEARGVIPINRYVDANRRRWWPKVYVEWLKPYFDLKNNREISSQEFSSRVWNDWTYERSINSLPLIGDSDGKDGGREVGPGERNRGTDSAESDAFDQPIGRR